MAYRFLVRFEFKVGHGIPLAGSALDQTTRLTYAEHAVSIIVPPSPMTPSFDDDAVATPAQISDGVVTSAIVYRMGVEVEFDVENRVEHADLAKPVFEAAWGVAERALAAVIDRLRVDHDYYFVGPSHEPPQRHGKATMVDAATGERVPGRWPDNNVSLIMTKYTPVDIADLQAAADHVSNGEGVNVDDLLLADAREEIEHPEVFGEGMRVTFDATRAVLLAAVAAEVRIKRMMREHSDTDLLPLVDIALAQSRGIGKLTHKPMKAVTGRSLCEDQPQTYARLVADKVGLFQLRNRIAHDGYVPAQQEATNAVQAAAELFAWLAAI